MTAAGVQAVFWSHSLPPEALLVRRSAMPREKDNEYLSPLLSDIQDYGAEESDVRETKRPTAPPTTIRRQAATSSMLAPAVLSAMLLVCGYFLWQQSVQISQLQAEVTALSTRPPAEVIPQLSSPGFSAVEQLANRLQDELVALNTELEAMAKRIDELELASVDLTLDDTPMAIIEAEPGAELPLASALDPAAVSAESRVNEAVAATVPEPAPATPAEAEGDWFINLLSFGTEQAAERWVATLEDSPGPLQVVPISRADQTLYRVRVAGLLSKEDAQQAAADIAARWEVENAWVSSR